MSLTVTRNRCVLEIKKNDGNIDGMIKHSGKGRGFQLSHMSPSGQSTQPMQMSERPKRNEGQPFLNLMALTIKKSRSELRIYLNVHIKSALEHRKETFSAG